MIDALIKRLTSLLGEQRKNYETDVTDRVCKTFEQYHYLCGLIQGLATAERIANDLRTDMEKEADE